MNEEFILECMKTTPIYFTNDKFRKKVNELLEELEYNQNINLSQGLENRVDIDYIIERLTDCLGDDE